MNAASDFDQRLSAWLDEQAPMREPDGLTYAVLARTRRMRRMPGWANPERWLPVSVITRPALTPPLRAAWLVLVALLVLALAAGGVVVGSRLLAPARPGDGLNGAYPMPVGGAAVLAFDAWVGNSGGRTDGDIFTVRADGTGLRQLTNDPGIQSDVSWAPDGTRIAYRDWTSGSVMVMDTGGGDRVTLGTTGPTNSDCAGGLTWSPDGSRLLYPVAASWGGRSDLFIVASDGSSPGTRLLPPDISSASGVWSPDGLQIAFVGRDEASADRLTTAGTGVYVVDVGRGPLPGSLEPRRITDSGPDAAAYWLTPRWSPDSTRLAAVAGAANTCATPRNGSMDVFVMGSDGSDPLNLGTDGVDEFSPTWSPDGEHIAFQRQVDPADRWDGRPCTYRTWIADADGTDERRLDELGGDVFAPLWSPDGTRLVGLVVDTATGDFHLNVVTVDGSLPPVVLSDTSAASWQPVAAPLPPAPSFPATSSTPLSEPSLAP